MTEEADTQNKQLEATDWGKLSLADFLKRTPLGLLLATVAVVFMAGWGTNIALHDFLTSAEPKHGFALRRVVRTKNVEECLGDVKRFVGTKNARVVKVAESHATIDFASDDVRYFCVIDCNSTATPTASEAEVICLSPTEVLSGSMADQIMDSVH